MTSLTPIEGLALPTGERGDEGLFRFANPDPQVSLQNGAQFTWYEFFTATGAAADENNLDKVAGVVPLGKRDVRNLLGKTVCAVVFDSDVSVDTSDGYGSLIGATLGTTAFHVTKVKRHPDRGSYLPVIKVHVLGPEDRAMACGP